MLLEICYDVQDITLACLVIWPDVTIYQRSVDNISSRERVPVG
uniref:Uncharacterized protein n=1 Tax=Heterorhabditis bacteriophora TaxID=37862 RepID=A0A1I7WCT5_HETBA